MTWGYPFTFRSGRSRGFTGQYSQGGHAGIDYTPGNLTPIHAAADGTIIISGVSGSDGAYGESIWIQHADGYRTIYAHMTPGTRVGTGPVKRGDYIGRVGNTGNSFGAHLHIELHHNGVAINPDPFINAAPLAGTTPQPPEPPEEQMPFYNHKQSTAPLNFAANTSYLATFNGVLLTSFGTGDTNLAAGGAGVYDLDIPMIFQGLYQDDIVTVNLVLQNADTLAQTNWYQERFTGNVSGEARVTHSTKLVVPPNYRVFLRITPSVNVQLQTWGRMLTNYQGLTG